MALERGPDLRAAFERNRSRLLMRMEAAALAVVPLPIREAVPGPQVRIQVHAELVVGTAFGLEGPPEFVLAGDSDVRRAMILPV